MTQHIVSPVPVPDGGDELLTVQELGAILKVSPSSVYRLIGQRAIPFYRLRGGLRFRAGDVKEFLRQSRVEAMR